MVPKFTIIDDVTRAVVRVNDRLGTSWVLVPFVSRDSVLRLTVSLFVSVFARSGSLWDLFISPYSDSYVWSIVTKLAIVHDVTRPIVGIDCRFRSTGIFVPFVARDPVLRLTVGIFRYILTWTWSYGNVFISPDSNCDILCIISKFAVVYNVTWSIVWVNLRLRPAWTLVPFMTRCPIFGQAISVFVSILARSRCQRNLRFAPYADSVIWKIISKLFSDSVGARSVVGIFFQFRSSRILVPLVGGCSVLGLPISFFVLILARPRTFVNFLLATHADRTLIEIGPEAESLIVV